MTALPKLVPQYRGIMISCRGDLQNLVKNIVTYTASAQIQVFAYRFCVWEGQIIYDLQHCDHQCTIWLVIFAGLKFHEFCALCLSMKNTTLLGRLEVASHSVI